MDIQNDPMFKNYPALPTWHFYILWYDLGDIFNTETSFGVMRKMALAYAFLKNCTHHIAL